QSSRLLPQKAERKTLAAPARIARFAAAAPEFPSPGASPPHTRTTVDKATAPGPVPYRTKTAGDNAPNPPPPAPNRQAKRLRRFRIKSHAVCAAPPMAPKRGMNSAQG